MSRENELRLFLIAGEASADLYAASLVEALREIRPSLSVSGVGGPLLWAQGARLFVDASRISAMGANDWWDRAAEIWRGYRRLCRAADEEPIDVAVLIDLPEINMRLASRLKRRGIPVVYYVSPQVWAWRQYRVRQIGRRTDKRLVVFPFERDFYLSRDVSATFVGHPLLESVRARESLRSSAELASSPRVALLPGSRPSELRMHAPLLRETIALLRAELGSVEFRAPVALTLEKSSVREALGDGVSLVSGPGAAGEVLRWADAAAVASGTATLECALVGTPFSLFYRVTKMSAWIARSVVGYRGYIGMPNVILKREAVPELFQEKATPVRLRDELIRLLRDDGARAAQADSFREVRKLLGESGASRRAALEVLSVALDSHHSEVAVHVPVPSPA